MSKDKFSCDIWAKNIKESEEFNMIYLKHEGRGRDITLYGRDLRNKHNIEYDEGSGWLENIVDTLKAGDTITKIKGEYSIVVKRKSQKFIVSCRCDRIYPDTPKTRPNYH